MDCDALREDPWERLREFAPGGRKGKRGPRTDNRRFLNALLWMARSGGRWRDLPRRFGKPESVKRPLRASASIEASSSVPERVSSSRPR